MIRRIAAVWIALMVAGAFAQDSKSDQHTKPEEHARYRLEFVLKQMEHGKVMSTHNFTMSAEANTGASQIRTGNRVPVDTGGDKGINYIDVGFNCDARIDRPGNGSSVGLDIGWELSTMPAIAGSEKLIRQVRVRSTPSVQFGKSTLVGSVDDINSMQQFELDVTVTPES
jgi:hypothetical protein